MPTRNLQFAKHFFGTSFAIIGAQLFSTGAIAAQLNHTNWSSHNRTLSANLSFVHQDYKENDPFGYTTDGTLDTEIGTLRRAEISARWQAETVPLHLQFTARRNNGPTQYSGYLQTGAQLTPYRTTTGNIMFDFAARAGLPIAQSESWQWIPFIEYQHHRWQRELSQYTENFRHTAALAGLQLQWKQLSALDNTGPWSFELEGELGKMLDANMEAASLGFDQTLGKRRLWQLGAAVSYDITQQWRISGTASTRHFNYGQSAVQNGMLEPTNKTQQTTFGIGLGWRY